MHSLIHRFSFIYFALILLVACVFTTVSCKKPDNNDTKLSFSCENNIVTFDTVFTSIGSATKRFTVHNTSNQDVKTNIYLLGKRSNFSINVNGVQGISFKDVEIPKKDSIYIFVKVNVDPGNVNDPFLIEDELLFVTGKHDQKVLLMAYGQDAHYIVADAETGYKIVAGEHETVTWVNDKPYVVYGWAVVDSDGTLIIDPGVRIHFHNNSGLWAYRYSNLEVNGTLEQPVLFRGDRLEAAFNDEPDQWTGIWINEGVPATINYAIIANAHTGFQINPMPLEEGLTYEPDVVRIENTIIKNSKKTGVLSMILNVEMTNCVIAKSGDVSLWLEGGNYTMKHITVGNFFYGKRSNPACYVSNKSSVYATDTIGTPLYCDVTADFVNCIIYGRNEDEVYVYNDEKADCKVVFQNCLIQAKDNSDFFKDCIRNEDPKFTDVDKYDFMLMPESPAIGKGKDIGILFDILGKPRSNPPDIGAYQAE